MESNRAARTMFDTLLENCIFYISQLYEFSHRLGQTRPRRSKPYDRVCPLCPQSDRRRANCDPTLCANKGHLPDDAGILAGLALRAAGYVDERWQGLLKFVPFYLAGAGCCLD
jgi:hypothetical protein